MNNIFLEVKRKLGESIKYKFNLIFANTSLIILFYTLTEYLFVEDKEIIFFMLFCWYFATHGMSIPTYNLENEVFDRTLVSVIQSKTSIVNVLFHRSIVQIIIDIVKGVPVFFLLYLLGNYNFSSLNILSWIYIILGIFLTIFTSYGMGFLFCSLVTVYQRAGNFIGLLDYFILFFSGITVEISNNIFLNIINRILPFSNLRYLISNLFLGNFDITYLGLLILQCIIWGCLGSFTLKKAVKYSIEKGLIYNV
ncbi:ABC transporter permease [Alkaliphilus sp. B6464]|uniref:ABC transporter permease n=1 Tax=Alkaliphilus sp. B6464 TaxID=2731219 RepID=UPI001BA50EE5|nr:ABC transporter permease [Alkaliphilus sp. B6464]QUH18870.1 ABC transporter permease [Alkaliphilus sp. B6464]